MRWMANSLGVRLRGGWESGHDKGDNLDLRDSVASKCHPIIFLSLSTQLHNVWCFLGVRNQSSHPVNITSLLWCFSCPALTLTWDHLDMWQGVQGLTMESQWCVKGGLVMTALAREERGSSACCVSISLKQGVVKSFKRGVAESEPGMTWGWAWHGQEQSPSVYIALSARLCQAMYLVIQTRWVGWTYF